MTAPQRPDARLGEGLAAVLRVGTILAVLIVTTGFVVASMTGLPSRGRRPLVEVVFGAGPDAPIAIGLLALTVLPVIAIAYAAWFFARAGERVQALTAVAVLALLLGGLAIAIVVGPAS